MGLGNQLSIYSAGRRLAARLEVGLVLSPMWFLDRRKRVFELGSLVSAQTYIRLALESKLNQLVVRVLGEKYFKLDETLKHLDNRTGRTP